MRKRIMSLVLAMTMIITLIPSFNLTASAATSGTCGENLTWTLDDEGTLTISGTGEMWDYWSSADYPWDSYRKSIKNVIVKNGVTSIAFFAFGLCDSLISVSLPESVEYIENFAFEQSSNLQNIFVSETNPVYSTDSNGILYDKGKTELIQYPLGRTNSHFDIPDSVFIINDGAFSGCKNLSSIAIHENVYLIGNQAFGYCPSLSNIVVSPLNSWYFADNNGVLFDKDKKNLIVCPAGRNLTNYNIPDGVVSIESSAFINCKTLISVNIPDSVLTIDVCAFQGCTSLTSVTIPDGVTTIGNSAFYGCSSLENITIPNSVTSIRDRAFFSCSSLKDVYYGGTEEQWNNISIGGFNDSLTNATIHYNGGTIPSKTAKLLNTDLSINNKGKAYARIVLEDTNGNAVASKKISYKFNGYSGTYQATTDEDGVLTVITPTLSGSGTKTLTVVLSGADLKENTFTFDVEITPLTFTQTWEGKVTAIGGVEAELGVDGTIGVVEAEAKLASIGAEMKNARILYLSNGYEGGKRVLEIGNKLDANLALKADVGVMADLKTASKGDAAKIVDLSAADINGSTGYGYNNEAALKIDGYNPDNPEHLMDVGLFLLDSAMGINGSNVILREILKRWDVTPYNEYGATQKIKLSAGGNIGAAKVSSIKGSLGGISTDAVFSSGTKTDKDGAVTHSSGITAEAGYKLGSISYKKDINKTTDSKTSVAVFGQNFINNKVTISAKTQSNDLKSLSIKSLENSDNHSIFWKTETEDDYKTLTYSGNHAKKVAEGNEDITSLANGEKSFFTTKQMVNATESALTSDYTADYSREKEISKGFDAELTFGITAGLGFELGMGVSGIRSTEYEYETGKVTAGNVYKTSESDIKSAVKNNSLEFTEILSEAGNAIGKQIDAMFDAISGAIEDGVEKAKAKVKGTVDWVCDIFSFNTDTYAVASYSILTVDDEMSLFSTSAVATTVGEPYIVNVKDKSGNAITDFGDKTLTLTLSYDSNDLATAGVGSTEADLQNLKIYRWSEDKAVYVYVGGELDYANSSVATQIAQSGQYILAIDNCAPTITGFEVSNNTEKPIISATVADLSGINDFEFKIDDEIVVNNENLSDYYNSKTSMFKYEVKDGLASGEHTAGIYATDTSGNAMAEPIEISFIVDTNAPEITAVIIPEVVTEGSMDITATVEDDNLADVYTCIEYMGDIYTYEMTENNGEWSVNITELPEFAKMKTWVCAYDLVGNKNESKEQTVSVANIETGELGVGLLSVNTDGVSVAVANNTANATGKIVVAGYDENGNLVDVQTVQCTGGVYDEADVNISTSCDTYKVFFWKDIQLLSPLCKSYEFINTIQ